MRGDSPALVLNADFRPLSYFPLSVWSWQDAVKAVFLDRVNIVSEYEEEVRSPSFSMRLPSVIALKQYVPLSRKPAFTRFNVFLRDRFAPVLRRFAGHVRTYVRSRYSALPRRSDKLGQRCCRLFRLQSGQGKPAAGYLRDDPGARTGRADESPTSEQWPVVSAEFPA